MTLEFPPALQARMRDGVPSLLDLLSGRSFEVKDPGLMSIIATLIDLVPDTAERLAEGLVVEMQLDLESSRAAIEALCELGLLTEASRIVTQKAGVQAWVDKGWIDALILHFASRDLHYVDDPQELGGDGELGFQPLTEEPTAPVSSQGLSYALRQPDLLPEGSSIINGIMSRRSFQPFSRASLQTGEIETILWVANLYARDRAAISFRDDDRDQVYDSAFSSLSSCLVAYEPIDLGSAILPPGAYHYDVESHSLVLLREGNLRTEVARIATGQRRASKGLFSIVICADWEAYSRRYPHERSYRNLLINTAQLAQFYLVLSSMLKLSTFMTPAIHDEDMVEAIGVARTMPMYLVTAG